MDGRVACGRRRDDRPHPLPGTRRFQQLPGQAGPRSAQGPGRLQDLYRALPEDVPGAAAGSRLTSSCASWPRISSAMLRWRGACIRSIRLDTLTARRG
ncbi:hypothetical protein G6F59_018750 [Rhizopus arrhizus]|nr:hypothetical protein G6F59_018750 [Rhizopus arrhizus]